MTPVGTAWVARRWDGDTPSHQAWKAIMADPRGVSCWRYAYPMRPPHRGYVVIVMGEDDAVVAEHAGVLLSHGGEAWTISEDQLHALRLRRLRQAIHAADTGETTQVREGISDTLHRDGQMRPRKP